ncbi:MAG: hypothetical protein [Mu-like cryoconite phage AB09]|nr:MAG: hypothetical protein [Mu-like cryoconite phage AB09]
MAEWTTGPGDTGVFRKDVGSIPAGTPDFDGQCLADKMGA